MAEVDLNLDNYNLQDLLNLFELSNNYNLSDLRAIKKRVVLLHPDKSKLHQDYFLFYCKAFRMLKNIYDFKTKHQNSLDDNNSTVEYVAEDHDDFDIKAKRQLLDNVLKKEKADFNKWFNENFEKMNIAEEQQKNGYGAWFQSNEDVDETDAKASTSVAAMHQKIAEKKEHLSSLVKRQEVQDIYMTSGSSKALDSSAPESYRSNMFSSLQYDDLRTAHTESVVPVSHSDYTNMRKFNNVESLKQHRNSQNIKPLSEAEATNIISNREQAADAQNIKLAYKLTRQEEQVAEANKAWWGNLMRLQ